ncbi:hypothetical protein Gorai_021344 [Gossypium raimondii]|uniref:Uncharacterized protein n=1 Tax=Gossypium raimondii TaxID=29730 RepID=A0A7J8NQ48_GOSRA|nr:hypothetical protein [Gossypium raimondii]
MHTLFCAMSEEDFNKVSSYESAKKI